MPSKTPLVQSQLQGDDSSLTVLRSYQLSTFSKGSTLRQEPFPITDGEVRTVPCYFAPQLPAEMLSECEVKLYGSLNRVYSQVYRFSYLFISILFIPFAILLPVFIAGLHYGIAYLRPLAALVGSVIGDVSPLLRYRTALARNALINSTGRTLQSVEEGKMTSDSYTVLV